MTHVLILSAKILKGAIVGGLALLSWGIHTFAPADAPAGSRAAHTVMVVTCANGQGSAVTANVVVDAKAAARVVRLAHRAERFSKHVVLLRLTEIVPPLRVEEVYSPDLLLPPSVLPEAPPLPWPPPASPRVTRDTSRTT
ncbi:MAG: hypothetical protein U0167_17155 [bacterium]